MSNAIEWARRRCENIAAAMLAIMFLAFMAQIICRYLLNLPTGWMNELSVILWLWLVLFGSAFVVREPDEMRFDLFYGSVRDRTRRGMALITAVALIVLFGMSLPASWSYVTFMKVEKASYLGVRMDLMYSIYIVFSVAVIARCLRQLVRGPAPKTGDISSASAL